MFGGFEGSGATSSIQIYDETTGVWRLATETTPIALQQHDAITLSDGRILVGGGLSNDRWWFFDTTTNIFTETTSAPASYNRTYQTCQSALDSGLVYLGGGVSTGNTDDTFIFNPTTEVWSLGATLLPKNVSSFSTNAVFIIKGAAGNLYLFDAGSAGGANAPWVSGDTL